MNRANQLTLIRIGIVPLFIAFLTFENFYARLTSLLVFIGAGITDLYDGAIARRTQTITIIGTFLDPLADKLLMSAAFITFLSIQELGIPSWMVFFIVARELIVTAFRSLAAAKGRVLAADTWGKFKTSSQVAVVITIMLILLVNSFMATILHVSLDEYLFQYGWRYRLAHILQATPYWLMLASMVITILSGVSYFYHNRDLLSEELWGKNL